MNSNAGRDPTTPIVELTMSGLHSDPKISRHSHYYLTIRNHMGTRSLDSEPRGGLYKVLKVTHYKDTNPQELPIGSYKKILPIPRGIDNTVLANDFTNYAGVHELMHMEAYNIANQLITETKPAHVIVSKDLEEKMRGAKERNETPLYRSKFSLFE